MAKTINGVIVTEAGALTVLALASTAAVPATANEIPGNTFPFGKAVSALGELYVRFV